MKKLHELRVVDLKRELEERDLDTTGIKATLQHRLKVYMVSVGQDPETFTFEEPASAESMLAGISEQIVAQQEQITDQMVAQQEKITDQIAAQRQNIADQMATQREEVLAQISAQQDQIASQISA